MVWVGDAGLAKWASSKGFGNEFEYSNNQLAAIPSKVSGLYVFEAENHDAYIGISTDLRSRLKEHARRHTDIKAFRLRKLATSPLELREIERSLVHSAQKTGLTVRNREHAMTLEGNSSLDALIPHEEQKAWLYDSRGQNATDSAPPPEYTPSQVAAHASSFRRLEQHPRAAEVEAAIGAYLRSCVPFPSRTEGTFWTVSCFPGSSSARLACVSMAMLEMFYIWTPPASDSLQVRMFVDGTRIPKKLLASRLPWRKLGPGVWFGPRAHKSGGVNERTIVVDDISLLAGALEIPGVAQAAAYHALAVMKKRQSGYKPSHCPQLAAAAVDRSDSFSSEQHEPSTVATDVEAEYLETVDGQVEVSEAGDEQAQPTYTSGESQKFDQFLELDIDGRAMDWLSTFIARALPEPTADAGVHWGLTCLPSTGAGRGKRRMFTVNVGSMEVAYLTLNTSDSAREMVVTVVVSAAGLELGNSATIDQLQASYPQLTFDRVGYVAAAGDDVSVSWSLSDDTADLAWTNASAALVDSVRGARCPYGRYHSRLLLDQALTST